MQPVQPTTTITIDNSNFEVSKMSPDVQALVAYFDDWRQQEVDTASKLLQVRSALEHLRGQLLEQIQKERAEALEKASAMGIIPPAPAESDAQE